MIKRSSIKKIITLSVFTTLLICFVCYRVGAFDNTLESTNGYEIDQTNFHLSGNLLDTPFVAKDSIVRRKEMMSSSKSIVIHREPYNYDTIKMPVFTDSSKKKTTEKTLIMGSSKSAKIFELKPTLDTPSKKKK
jgi:hypothetical protein